MADVWFAIFEQATGRLVSMGTVITDAETLAENGLVAQECVGFNPQAPLDTDPDGRHEWDETNRRFNAHPGTEVRRRRLLAVREQEAVIEAEMQMRGETVPPRTR